MKERIVPIFMIALLAISTVAGVGVVAAQNSAINYDEGPNPYVEEQRLDKATHNMSSMGPLDYSNDNGEIERLPAELNSSVDEQYRVRYDKIDDDDLRQFPRDKSGVSGLDASEWSTNGLTVSDTSGDVDGISVSGSSGTATFSNFSALSDSNKRVLLAIFNVNTLQSGANVEIRAVDADGDYKAATINSSSDPSTDAVAADATGNGYVYQQKLDTLSVQGSGDGSLDDVTEVTVSISGASADVTLTGLDMERKSPITLGKTMRDSDGDGDLETETVEEITTPGELEVTSLDSMGDVFDDAVISDLGVTGVQYEAKRVSSDDANVSYSDAGEFPNYDSQLDAYYRINVPTAIDLSHSGLTLKGEQKFVESRYRTVEYAEGSGDTEFSNVSSWTSLDSTYSSKGSTHTLDDTVQPGETYAFHANILLQSDEVRELQQTGGTGAPVSSGGGILNSIWTWITGALATLSFGYIKLRGSGS